MIRNQWYVVLEGKEVKRGAPVGVTRMGEKLVFWRAKDGNVVCQRDKCVHRGVALSEGKVINGEIECPFHGFRYDATGRCTRIPANSVNTEVPERFHVFTYPTREANGFIYIWWGEAREGLPPVPFFSDLGGNFSYGRISDPWNAHYSRVIENQLDVVHLPFIHHNTIGRGCRTVVDGPVVKWVDENRLRVFVFNRIDEGIPPRKTTDLEVGDREFWLEFVFPNLWQNHISEEVRVVAAFSPIDEENSVLYLRFYQKFIRIPLVRDALNGLSMWFNLVVARQDRRVVITQEPKPSELRSGEQLIPGDSPIVAYRRRREELKVLGEGGAAAGE
ncbi:MAG: aromatic ring-hydroxylating dioxygenase subunit alpha [Anaerolineales bacterium]|nr:aromatic ring-hydroxylating dioxygenase subunit alpha [Anaerolineales bacterium]